MSRRLERQPDPSPLGGYLASEVKKRGMTLADVADATGFSASHASKVFNGRIREPGSKFTVYLAKDLGLTVGDLLPYCESEWKVDTLSKIKELSLSLPTIIVDALKASIPDDPKLRPSFLKLVESLKQTALERRQARK